MFKRKDYPLYGTDRRTSKDPRDPAASRAASEKPPASLPACPTCDTEDPHPLRTTCPALKPKLEVVRSEIPILAKREALLNMGSFTAPFASITGQKRPYFGVLAKSHCSLERPMTKRGYYDSEPRHPRGDTPDPDCTCGFYAIPIDAANMYSYPASVTLLVELYGKVIEHDLGFRAEWQKVVECQVAPCAYCGRASDHLLISPDGAPERFVCAEHAVAMPLGCLYLSISDLEHRLGMPVTRLTY